MEKASPPSSWKNAGIRSPRSRPQHRTRDRCGRTDNCRKIPIALTDRRTTARRELGLCLGFQADLPVVHLYAEFHAGATVLLANLVGLFLNKGGEAVEIA